MDSIKSISIVGTGNVAFHLGKALINSGFTIVDVFGRNTDKASALANEFNCLVASSLSSLKGELVILSVNDQVIQELAEQIPTSKMIVHTSGAISIETLKSHELCGVLYPLQTMSKSRNLSFKEIPLLIEANDQTVFDQLEVLSKRLSNKVVHVNSEQRKNIHLAAVFVNNFVNHLILHAKNRMEEKNLDWNLLMPLLGETVNKIKDIGPFDAQTGPARRNDNKTICEHLELLSGIEKELYQLLTDSIKHTYNT